MRNYTKKGRGYEAVTIDKIEKGIRSIENGNRSGESVGKDLEFFFNKLEELNEGMYQELYGKYCIARLKAEGKEIKDIHS